MHNAFLALYRALTTLILPRLIAHTNAQKSHEAILRLAGVARISSAGCIYRSAGRTTSPSTNIRCASAA